MTEQRVEPISDTLRRMHSRGRRTASVPNSQQSRSFSEPKPARISRQQFAELTVLLAESKLSVTLTASQQQVWYTLLSPFAAKTVQRAMLNVIWRSEPFPNLGTVYEECRRVNGADEKSSKRPSEKECNTIARELGWQ